MAPTNETRTVSEAGPNIQKEETSAAAVVLGSDEKQEQKDTNALDKMEEKEPGVEVVDADGFSMKLLEVENVVGYKYIGASFGKEIVENIPLFKFRDDDVLIASGVKSGCHWLWDIVRMLQTGDIILDNTRKETCMMENCTQEEIDEIPSPRVLNNHQFYDWQPKDLFEKKIKTIMIYRNMKDIFTSFWHIRQDTYGGKVEHFLRRVLDGLVAFGNPIDHLVSWEKGLRENPDMPIFICSFEDLKKDPLPVLKGMAAFLGAKRQDEDFLRQIADATDIDKMRARKMTAGVNEEKKSRVARMYRKGVVGDWKNLFTVAQDEWFSKIVEEKLKDTRFKMVYE